MDRGSQHCSETEEKNHCSNNTRGERSELFLSTGLPAGADLNRAEPDQSHRYGGGELTLTRQCATALADRLPGQCVALVLASQHLCLLGCFAADNFPFPEMVKSRAEELSEVLS